MAANTELHLTIGVRDKASKELDRIGGSAKKMGDDVARSSERGADGLNSLSGKAASVAKGLAGLIVVKQMAGWFTDSVRAMAEFEAGLIGVGKTTNMTDSELRSLGTTIIDLNRKVPLGTSNLLEIAQAAGQMGVRGSANIAKFTETVAMLEKTTDDLRGSDAAKTLARILNVTNENIENVDRLGSVFVALGNSVAASEGEIARITNEVARSTAVFKLSSAEAAGIGASMAEMGIRAELGGSAFGRTMREIGKAIEEGGDKFKMLQVLTRKSAEELRDSFSRDSLGTMLDFLEGLGTLGEGSTQVLEDLGLAGDEIAKTMPVLAQGIAGVRQNIAQATEEFDKNTAAQEEWNRQTGTLVNEWARLKGEITEAGRSIASDWVPALESSVEWATKLVQKLSEARDVLVNVIANGVSSQSNSVAGRHGIGNQSGVGNLEARMNAIDQAMEEMGGLISGFSVFPTSTKGGGDALEMFAQVNQAVGEFISKSRESHGVQTDIAGQLAAIKQEQMDALEAKKAQVELERVQQSFINQTASLRAQRLSESIEGIQTLLAEQIAAAEKAGLAEADLAAYRLEVTTRAEEQITRIMEREAALRPKASLQALEQMEADYAAHIEEMKRIANQMKRDNDPKFAAQQDFDINKGLADEARKIGALTPEEHAASIARFKKELADATGGVDLWKESIDSAKAAGVSMVNSVGYGLSDMFTSIADGSMSASDAFKRFAQQMIADLTAMIAKMLVFTAIGAAIGFVVGGPAGALTGAQIGFNASQAGGFSAGDGPTGLGGIPTRAEQRESASAAPSFASPPPQQQAPLVINQYSTVNAIDAQSVAQYESRPDVLRMRRNQLMQDQKRGYLR